MKKIKISSQYKYKKKDFRNFYVIIIYLFLVTISKISTIKRITKNTNYNEKVLIGNLI